MFEVFSFGFLWLKIELVSSRASLVQLRVEIKKSLYKHKDS